MEMLGYTESDLDIQKVITVNLRVRVKIGLKKYIQ